MMLNGGIAAFVHTKVTFQVFNALEHEMVGAYYVHTQEGEVIKVRVRCSFSLCEDVITLGELIGLLILFCHPLLSILLFCF